jgi:hypothetical protein
MQFERRFADAIKSGEVTLTFRRWARPQAVAGHRYRVPQIGFVDVTCVDEIDEGAITLRDAKRAGFATLQQLRDYMQVKARAAGTLYRIELRYAGVGAPDARAALAQRVANDDESGALGARLDAMDRRSTNGAWTRHFLSLIEASPGTRAGDLAARIGWDTAVFKAHVRRLKELGLTESLEVGYRLSARGAAFARAERRDRRLDKTGSDERSSAASSRRARRGKDQ